eukprot:974803-Heterocapsa_arctica.AAC.1
MGETKKNAARGSSSGSGRPLASRQVFEVVRRLWCELAHEQEASCTSFSRARDLSTRTSKVRR